MRIARGPVLLAIIGCVLEVGCFLPDLKTTAANGQDPAIAAAAIAAAAAQADAIAHAPCVEITFNGDVTFDGTASSYNGACTIAGSVTVTEGVTDVELNQLQKIKEINGNLTLTMGKRAAELPFPELTAVTGIIRVDQCVGLTKLSFPAIKADCGGLVVNGNTVLGQVDFAGKGQLGFVRITANGQMTWFDAPELSVITQDLHVFDDPALHTLIFNSLKSVTSLDIELTALTGLTGIAAGVSIGTWRICNNPKIPASVVTDFGQSHPTGKIACP